MIGSYKSKLKALAEPEEVVSRNNGGLTPYKKGPALTRDVTPHQSLLDTNTMAGSFITQLPLIPMILTAVPGLFSCSLHP